jgi:predicted transcriptional regulator
MSRAKIVQVDVELDKDNIEALDREAARLGCTRENLIGQAVEIYIERHRHVLDHEKAGADDAADVSGTGNAAMKPPTDD